MICLLTVRFTPFIKEKFAYNFSFQSAYESLPCYQNVERNCLIVGEEKSKHKVLWIGDSHTLHLYGMAEVISRKEKLNIHLSAANGCPYILDYIFIDRGNITNTAFCQQRNPLFDLERLQDYSHIIISNFWANKHYVKDRELYRYLDLMLEKLAKLNRPVYIVNSSGYLTRNLNRLKHFEQLGLNYLSQQTGLFTPDTSIYVDFIKQRVENHPQIIWIDLRELVQQVIVENPDMRAFFDYNHLTVEASRKLGEVFMDKYPNLFK